MKESNVPFGSRLLTLQAVFLVLEMKLTHEVRCSGLPGYLVTCRGCRGCLQNLKSNLPILVCHSMRGEFFGDAGHGESLHEHSLQRHNVLPNAEVQDAGGFFTGYCQSVFGAGVRTSQRLRGHRPLHPTMASMPQQGRMTMDLEHAFNQIDGSCFLDVRLIASGSARYCDLDNNLVWGHLRRALYRPKPSTAQAWRHGTLTMGPFAVPTRPRSFKEGLDDLAFGRCELSYHARTMSLDSLLCTQKMQTSPMRCLGKSSVLHSPSKTPCSILQQHGSLLQQPVGLLQHHAQSRRGCRQGSVPPHHPQPRGVAPIPRTRSDRRELRRLVRVSNGFLYGWHKRGQDKPDVPRQRHVATCDSPPFCDRLFATKTFVKKIHTYILSLFQHATLNTNITLTTNSREHQ